MKFTKVSCGHMFEHFSREAKNISNENLNRAKTCLNYNLAVHQTMDQYDFMKKRCSEVQCLNRKDVNVMVSWIVTVPKELPEIEYERFFMATYDFLERRYGKENVISSYVHMDEVTPHMHFAFVPVKRDFKKNKNNPGISVEYYKVSAKEVVNRYDLKSFHLDLQSYVEKKLRHSVSILNEATKEGNKSIEELKRQSAVERLDEANRKASEIVLEAQEQMENVKGVLIPLRAEYEAKKAYMDACDECSEVSMMYPDYAKLKKGFFGKETVTVPREKWEQKHISANEKSLIKRATAQFEKSVSEFYRTSSAKTLSEFKKKVDFLEDEVLSLEYKNSVLEKIVESEKNKNEKLTQKVFRIISKMPKEVVSQFTKHWEAEEKKLSLNFKR